MNVFHKEEAGHAQRVALCVGAWRLLLIAVLALVTAAPALAARRALVIGIDNYRAIAPLRNARADAEAMAAALRRVGYEVDLQTDRSLKQLQADVRAFRQRIAGGDEVVVFFSGHGVQLGGTNYLLPTDVSAESEDQVRDDALALSKVLEDLRERKPRFTLAIVDACRDNPFASAGKAIGGRGLTGVAGATGQMVIYAAGEGQRALDRLGGNDPVRNGVFTRVFIREMAKPGASIREVLFRVRDEVATLAESVRHEQVPAVYDQVRGNYYFMPPGEPVNVASTPPAALPSSLPMLPAPSVVSASPATATGQAATPRPAPVREKVTFAGDVLFEVASSKVPADGASMLQGMAQKIQEIHLEVVLAIGHADATETDAHRLSVRRAEAAKAALVLRGIEANRVYTEGKGAAQPVADNKTADGRAKNRRVELEVVGIRDRR